MAINIGELYLQLSLAVEGQDKLLNVINKLDGTVNKLSGSIDKMTGKMSSGFSRAAKESVSSSNKIKAGWEKQLRSIEDASLKVEELAISLSGVAGGKKALKTVTNALNLYKMEVGNGVITTEQLRAAQHKLSSVIKRTKLNLKASAAEMREVSSAAVTAGESMLYFGQRAKGASHRLSGASSKTRNLGFGVQNVAYQLQDMIVQFEMGTNASRVLGQQLPQLFSGFGPLGAVIGTAAAALAWMIPYLISSGEESENAADKVDVYKESLKTLQSVTEDYNKSQARLNNTMRDFELSTLRAAVAKAEQDIQTVRENLRKISQEEIGGFAPLYADLLKNNSKLRKAEENLKQMKDNLTQATERQRASILNNIRADINLLQGKEKLFDKFKKGVLSLKEYEIQSELLEKATQKGILKDKEALILLEKEIRLRHKLKDTKDQAPTTLFETIQKFLDDYGSSINYIINGLSQLVSAQYNAYQQIASYHKQMANDALSYGKSQSEMWMQLADTVYYSNNAQAQSFRDKAVAIAEAQAKEYRVHKAAQAQANAQAKKAFENQKKLQMAQAIMSTAKAVMDTYTNTGLGIFAAPLAAAMAAVGAAQISLISSQQFTPREKGGSITGGKPYLVGEAGPELIVPGRGGTVVNNRDLMDSVSSGGTNVSFQIQALDTKDSARIIYENRGMIINILREAQNNSMGRY